MLEVMDPAASLLLELLPATALAALAACAPEPAAGWACADLVSRLGAPLADLEALRAYAPYRSARNDSATTGVDPRLTLCELQGDSQVEHQVSLLTSSVKSLQISMPVDI